MTWPRADTMSKPCLLAGKGHLHPSAGATAWLLHGQAGGHRREERRGPKELFPRLPGLETASGPAELIPLPRPGQAPVRSAPCQLAEPAGNRQLGDSFPLAARGGRRPFPLRGQGSRGRAGDHSARWRRRSGARNGIGKLRPGSFQPEPGARAQVRASARRPGFAQRAQRTLPAALHLLCHREPRHQAASARRAAHAPPGRPGAPARPRSAAAPHRRATCPRAPRLPRPPHGERPAEPASRASRSRPPTPPQRAPAGQGVRRRAPRVARLPGGPRTPAPTPGAGTRAGPPLPDGPARGPERPGRGGEGARGRQGRGHRSSPDTGAASQPSPVGGKMEPGAGRGGRGAGAAARAR